MPTQPEIDWVRVTRAHPCPVCGGPKWCSVSRDGAWAFCMSERSDRPSKSGERGWMHALTAPGTNGHGRARGGLLTRYEIERPTDHAVVAVHVRRDLPEGGKDVWWERPDGSRGLGGGRVEDLPLYGLDVLAERAPGSPIVL